MLENRNYTYFPKLEHVKIEGLPPEGWDDMTTEDQFKEINKMFKTYTDGIKSVQFDY